MAAMATDELRCIICPKAPTFSDQSHLLTHIGSKGHLSHYFKAQVRGTTDIAIQQRLATYDEWYRKNGIATLLSQRLETKDHKQKRPSKRVVAKSSKASESAESALKTKLALLPPVVPPADHVSFDDSCIDPYLERMEYYESDVYGKKPSPPMGNNSGVGHLAPHDPSMISYAQVYDQNGHWLPYCQPLESESVGQAGYATAKEWFFDKAPSEVPLPSIEGSASVSHSRNTSTTEGSTVFDANSNSHRLKGAVWPGMDLFDTANEESKRRRNQKKDISALHQLAKYSEAIEPTEVIFFYPSWEVKKARFISGNVESSPPRDLTPDPKPRPQRKRRALKELDSNLSVKPRKTRGSKRFKKPASFTRPRRGQEVLSGSENETLDLMRPLYGRTARTPRALKVFEDSPGDGNAPFNQAEYTPTPVYSGYSLRSHGFMQQNFETGRLTQAFATARVASTGNATHKHRRKDLGSTPDSNTQLFLPESPLRSYTESYGRGDTDLSQLVTPHRVFLNNFDLQKEFSDPAEPLGRTHAHLQHQQQSIKRSPTGFSLTDLLAYNRLRTPHLSPQKQAQNFWSPSYFDFKAAMANDLAEESSGDETIDLGIGKIETGEQEGHTGYI